MSFRSLTPFFLLCTLIGISSMSLAQPTSNAQYTEEGTEGCLRCHSGDKMRAVAASPHGNLEDPSAPLAEANMGCESCHGPGSIHVSRAFGGQGFPRLLTYGSGTDASVRDGQLGSCLSCHSESLIADADKHTIAAIEFEGSVHDRGSINCSSCHLVHAESDPIREQGFQADTCYGCHTSTEERHPRFEDKSIDFGALSCWTCHDVHKSTKLVGL